MAIHIRRREFVFTLGGVAAAWPLAARAQQAIGVRRIGVLMNAAADDPEFSRRVRAFVQELERLGWTDGRNLRFEYRWAADYGTELVALAPDVILASATSHAGPWEAYADFVSNRSGGLIQFQPPPSERNHTYEDQRRNHCRGTHRRSLAGLYDTLGHQAVECRV